MKNTTLFYFGVVFGNCFFLKKTKNKTKKNSFKIHYF